MDSCTPQFEWYTGVHMGFSPEQTNQWLAGELAFPNSGGKKLLDIPMRRAGRMEELGGVAAFLGFQSWWLYHRALVRRRRGRHAFSF